MIDVITSLESRSVAKNNSFTIGSLGNRNINVLNYENNSEEVLAYLEEINQPPKETIEFTAALLTEMELEILEELITKLQRSLEFLREDQMTKEEFSFPKTLTKDVLNFAGKTEQKKCSLDFKPSLNHLLAGEILEQRSKLSKSVKTKECTAPFFSIAAKKEGKKEESIHSIHHKDIPIPQSIYSNYTPYPVHEKINVQKEQHEQNSDHSQDQENRQSQDQNKERDKEQERERAKKALKGIYATTTSSSSNSTTTEKTNPPLPPVKDVGDVFHNFLILMERILGQAQAEAHQLYRKIKERTDQVELLTKLIGKLNLVDGKVDWTKEDLKTLLESLEKRTPLKPRRLFCDDK